MAEYTLDEIKEYWRKQAQTHGTEHEASWGDQWAIDMEVREMLKWLEDGQAVLDVGCANGYSSIQYASQRSVHVRGLDLIPEMISEAGERSRLMSDSLMGQVEFGVGDISSLDEPSDTYDRVIVTRVVINLGDWDRQAKALGECCRVLKSGGMLLLSEATVQGWQRMNEFRAEWGLGPIPVPPFNQYLDENSVIEALTPTMTLVGLIQFASTYYVGTRVLKPLLAKAIGGDIDVANANMNWNEWFSKLPAVGDYGTQKLFVFKKK